jgi:transposase
VHHSKPVKAWLAEHTDRIEVFYLPSYSPELNPEECLNADLKQAMGKRAPVRTKARLREAANEHMVILEKSPGPTSRTPTGSNMQPVESS